MLTLEKMRDAAIEMRISQTGKNNHYNFNEEHIAFVEGVTMFILPNIDVYKESVEQKGFVYDADLYIPFVESL